MFERLSVAACALVALSCLAAGCTTTDNPTPEPSVTPSWPLLECDPLVPEVCGFPYPSNVFTVVDPATPTGRRLALSSAAMPAGAGKTSDPAPFNQSDGFSPGIALYAYLPGASNSGLPTPLDIDSSLSPSSPTILLDTSTGERVPHYADLDKSGTDPEQRALMIRPAVRLKDGTRYVVAMADILGADGNPLPASEAFAALRDGTASGEPSVMQRRALYDDIFARLAKAGVSRSGLQLAWDFTTASRENNTGWMLHMRDVAMQTVGPNGPSYTIDSVDTDFNPDQIAFRIQGTMQVPQFLDQPNPGAKLVRDEKGMPMINPSAPTQDVKFEVLIPHSATTKPAALIQYGHGLLGKRTQIESGHFLSFINEYNYILFAVDLAGMAEEDEGWIANTVVGGELHTINAMFDRLHQGVLNNLMAMRLMITGFAADPTYGAFIDKEHRYYHGISQGGIFGGVYMGLSPDVRRGALGVPGQSYNLLLNRSVDFEPFFIFFKIAYPDARDQQLALALLQQLWDRVEPTGYTANITGHTLPGTPVDKQVLMRAAIGDHQVTTLGGHIMARAMNAVHVDQGLRDVWGLPSAITGIGGASYVEYGFGLPPEPLCNLPQSACDDPHGKLRKLEPARQQLDHFLRTGEVKSFCDGPCDFPEQSGCAENPPPDTDPCAD